MKHVTHAIVMLVCWFSVDVMADASHVETSAGTTGTTEFVEGIHYQKLDDPISVRRAGETVNVTEFFSYLCVHCFNFEEPLSDWVEDQGERVEFQRLPAAFNTPWVAVARTYFAAQRLGLTKEMHQPIFDAFHVDNMRMSIQDMAFLFFLQARISEERFVGVYDSQRVTDLVNTAHKKAVQAKLRAVPALLIDGRYLTTGAMAGDNEGMLEVADFLINNVVSERQSS